MSSWLLNSFDDLNILGDYYEDSGEAGTLIRNLLLVLPIGYGEYAYRGITGGQHTDHDFLLSGALWVFGYREWYSKFGKGSGDVIYEAEVANIGSGCGRHIYNPEYYRLMYPG